jgi:acyl-coenzyme A synthetase/AMP-(fatty) acid ligase
MFGECISYRAKYQPDTPALETPKGPISYRRFEADINRMAAALAGLGLQPRSRVLISDSRPYIHWLLIFALERLGHVSMSDDAAGVTISVVPPDAILSETDKYRGRAATVVETTVGWLGRVLGMAEVAAPAIARADDDPIRIALSSGTTGRPRPLLYNRGQFDRGLGRMMFAHLPPRMRMLSPMGLNINAGWSYAVGAWITGGTAIYAGAMPLAEAIRVLHPTFMVMSPAQLQQLLTALPANAPPIPELQVLLGGSPPPRRLLSEARARLTGDLLSGYGAAEVALVAMASAETLERHPYAAGFVLPWAAVEIVDDAGQPLPPGELGIVRVRSVDMARHYFESTDATSAAFRDGWFYPGDMGSLQPDGLLVIAGRVDDVINAGGVKVAAFVVEERLRDDERVTDAAAFALPTAGVPLLAAVVVTAADPAEVARAYEQKHRQPIAAFKVDAIPRNQMGKIMRGELIGLAARPTQA